jgi:hypothetical protein
MSSEAAVMGTPRQLSHEGKQYPVQLITGRVQTEFERLVMSRAHDRLFDQRKSGRITRKEYLAELRQLGEREDRGEFSFLTISNVGLLTSWGQKKLLGLLMPGVDEATIDKLHEERTDDVLWVLQRVMEDSFPETIKRAKQEQSE